MRREKKRSGIRSHGACTGDVQCSEAGEDYGLHGVIKVPTPIECVQMMREKKVTKMGPHKRTAGGELAEPSRGVGDLGACFRLLSSSLSTVQGEDGGGGGINVRPLFIRRSGAYKHLMNEEDEENLRWLKIFSKYDLYSKSKVRVDVEKVKPYYLSLIQKIERRACRTDGDLGACFRLLSSSLSTVQGEDGGEGGVSDGDAGGIWVIRGTNLLDKYSIGYLEHCIFG